jgi:hypothetical protein
MNNMVCNRIRRGQWNWKQATKMVYSKAHFILGSIYREGGDSKKAKFHHEAAAIAGNEAARNNRGLDEYNSDKRE